MAYIERQVVTATTDTNGDATVYTDAVNGFIQSIRYVKTDFTNGVDFTVTAEASGAAIWTGTDVNASTTVYPRGPTHDTAGAAALYAAGGSAVLTQIPVVRERVKIVVASGGSTHTGVFHVYVGG